MRVKKQLEKKRECSFSDDEDRVSKHQYVDSDIGGLKCNDDCSDDATLADSSSEKIQRRSKRLSSISPNDQCCIFCSTSSGKLHHCSTMGLDCDLRKMAEDLQDTGLMAKLSSGDLIAIEAKYHYNCLSTYKNRHRSFIRSQQSCDNTYVSEEKQILARAFAELVCHIEHCVENDTHIFKLSQLHNLFLEHLQYLGYCKDVHKTVLKKQLLEHFSEQCQAQSDGKNCLLVFNEGFKKLLKESASFRDFESEAFLMTKLVKLMRKEIFGMLSYQFSGNFASRCQENSIPTILKTFISMLLSGPNLQHQGDHESQACLTISQLIRFNIKSKRSCAESNRHCKDKETPLPLYIGLNIHTQTRSKKLVSNLHKLGISISYSRVIELENHLASAMCKRFQNEDLVCPSHLRNGLFTVGALDNIDHNPSSTIAQGSFHGTGISIFQFPTTTNVGIFRDPLVIPSTLDFLTFLCQKVMSMYQLSPLKSMNWLYLRQYVLKL